MQKGGFRGGSKLSFQNFRVWGFGSLEGESLGYSRGENPKQRGGDTWKDERLLVEVCGKQQGEVPFWGFETSRVEE
jgi:hypothetical protein